MTGQMWSLSKGRCGQPTLTFVDGQRSCHLHSLYDPLREAQALVSSWDIDRTTKHVTVVGLGLGYHLAVCLEHFPWLQTVEVIECHEDVVRLANETFPELLSDPRITVRVMTTEALYREAIGHINVLALQLHPPSVSVIPFEDIRLLLQEMQMLRATTKNQSKRLWANWTENRRTLHKDCIFTGKGNSRKGQPGILVAAGPSLDSRMTFVRDHAQDAFILSVSTALRTLLNSGIIPDYCIVSDSSPKIAEHFEGIQKSALPELLLLGTVHPSIRENYQGKVTWVLQRGFAPAEAFSHTGAYDLFDTGGSVATLALSVLHYLGCDPIIFVGQDLAYVDGRTHVGGAHQGLDEIGVPSVSTVTVNSIEGKPVLSNLSWNSFRHWIEQFIASHPGRTYLNLSQGANIQGTYVPLYEDLNYREQDESAGDASNETRSK